MQFCFNDVMHWGMLLCCLICITSVSAQEWSLARALGFGNIEGAGCAIDRDRAVYVMGAFDRTVTIGTNVYSPLSETDTLLAKYSREGELLWSRRAGSFDHDFGYGVAIAPDGSIYSHGAHYAPLLIEGITNGAAGQIAPFLAKYDTDGRFQWVRTVAARSIALHTSAAVNEANQVFVAGSFLDTVEMGSTNLTARGGWPDVFVSSFDPAGNQLWAVPIGSLLFDRPYGIAAHGTNAVYVTGVVSSNAWFGSMFVTNVPAWQSAFVARLDVQGNIIWARLFGSQFTTEGYAIATDRNGDVVVVGKFQGTVPFDHTNVVSRGFDDLFVAKLSPSGTVKWVRSAGGAFEDWATGVAIDADGRIVVSGRYEGTAFFDSTNITSSGVAMFVATYSPDGRFEWVSSSRGVPAQEPYAVAASPDSRVWLLGHYRVWAQFGSHSVTNTSGDIDFNELVLACLDLPMRVDAARSGNDIRLSWTSPFHRLEQAPVTNLVWSAVTNVPAVAQTNREVTLPVTGAGRLFRLRRD